MEDSTNHTFLFEMLDDKTDETNIKRLADVFRFISFTPFETYGTHKHLRIEINYVKKGSCIIRLDNETITFRKSEVMIIPSFVNHFFEAGPEGATLMQLEFLPEMFGQLRIGMNGDDNRIATNFLSGEGGNVIKIVNNAPIVHTVQCIINELKYKKANYQHMVLMHYAELLVYICRYMRESYLPICTNPSFKKAIDFVRQNYCSNISISQVAAQSGVSERYLRRLFTRYTGLSPLDYLNQLRIGKAVELLRNTNMLIKEICFQCGFQSPQYFSRMFKQQMGVPPQKLAR